MWTCSGYRGPDPPKPFGARLAPEGLGGSGPLQPLHFRVWCRFSFKKSSPLRNPQGIVSFNEKAKNISANAVTTEALTPKPSGQTGSKGLNGVRAFAAATFLDIFASCH